VIVLEHPHVRTVEVDHTIEGWENQGHRCCGVNILSLSNRSTGDAKDIGSTSLAIEPTHRYLRDCQVIQPASHQTVELANVKLSDYCLVESTNLQLSKL